MTRDWNRRRFLAGVAAVPTLGAAAASPQVIGARTALRDAIRTQVLVVGAGASGVPAAIAAARAGAKVILVEEDAWPGGAPVDNYVAMVCGGVVCGIYAEMIAALDRDFHLGAKPIGRPMACSWFMPSAYVEVVARMLRAEPNLRCLCRAPVCDVVLSEGGRNRLRGVVIQCEDGRRQTIAADVVIDATGTGLVAALAGCQCRYGAEAKSDFDEPLGPEKATDRVQLCTLMMVIQRLRPDAKIDRTKIAGSDCPAEDFNAVLRWAGTVACRDTRDPLAIAEAQDEALLKIEKDVADFQASGYVAHIAPKLGVRETRRVVGDHVLSVRDLVTPKRPDDAVAVGTYPLDSWGDQQGAFGKASLSLTPGGYGIPFSSLVTKDMENLMVVGKSLSATHLAMSAVRVQCIVAQMGQAAGTAAAWAAIHRTGPRQMPIRDLQTRLCQGGIPLGSNSLAAPR